jgi:hypothetical protein
VRPWSPRPEHRLTGLAVWLAYRPSLEQSTHHVIGVLALSWTVVAAAMALAVVTAFFAASRPARAINKVPIVQALSGRPAPPRQIRRSAIALDVLGMSVGLVRSETASDLCTLVATGASSCTRRTLPAVTAGALGFLGALLGVVGGYIGMLGWLQNDSLNGGIAALGNVPVGDLLLILLGMPAFAAAVACLFAGREPAAIAHSAID